MYDPSREALPSQYDFGSPRSYISLTRQDFTQQVASYDESVYNLKAKCVVERKDEDFIVPTELQEMADDWNGIQSWGTKTEHYCESPKRLCTKRFKSIEAFFDSYRKNNDPRHYSLHDDQRYIIYSDEAEIEMTPIADIINLPLFCKTDSEMMKQVAEMSKEQAIGISFPVTNHYSDLQKHVLLLGLVPKRYEDAAVYFSKCRQESVEKKTEGNAELANSPLYYGPFFDGQLEIFILLYYILETQDLVNFKPKPNLEKCKQILSFLLGKLDKDNDQDLKALDKYVERVPARVLEERKKRMKFSKESEISLTFLFYLKRNYVKILAETDVAYHNHWHNLMKSLGLHHYRCPHTYNRIFSMQQIFYKFLPAYKRNCVNSDRTVHMDIRDIFRRYPNFRNNMPDNVNHAIYDLLNAFSYNFAKYMFKTNHYDRPLEVETINSYLTELNCTIKNLGFIIEPEGEVLMKFKEYLQENVRFLGFINNKSCSRFTISANIMNDLSFAVQRFLEKALPYNLLNQHANTRSKWDQIEKTITDFKKKTFFHYNDNSRSCIPDDENDTGFDETDNRMDTDDEPVLPVQPKIIRNDSYSYFHFDDCEFKYHEAEVTPTVCVGCCYAVNKTNRYIRLSDECYVAFCTWCAWCLNNLYSQYLPDLLTIIKEKYEKPIFLNLENQRITYEKIKELKKFTSRSYNRIKHLQMRGFSTMDDSIMMEMMDRATEGNEHDDSAESNSDESN